MYLILGAGVAGNFALSGGCHTCSKPAQIQLEYSRRCVAAVADRLI